MPYGQGDQHDQSGTRVAEPAYRTQTEKTKHPVNNSGIAENVPPHDGDSDTAANNGGQVIYRAVCAHHARLRIENHRHEQGKTQTKRNTDKHIEQRYFQRVQIFRITVEHSGVIVHPHPVRRGEQIIFGEGQVERDDHRYQRKA
ncbi:hypothetical protein D3C81_1645500 [compost metagenome]